MPTRLAPAPDELVLAHWTGITTRVAWTLLRLGVQPRADVVYEARLDAVLRLADRADPLLVEDHAEAHTEAWIARIRGRGIPPWGDDWVVPVTPDNVPIRRDDPDLLVLRRHYGDHRRLRDLVRAHGITLDTLEAARERLRRAAAQALGDPQAPAARIDQLLRRLAAWAPGPCPPVEGLVEARHRDHLARCPRCDRTARLIQREVVPLEDFVAPPSLPQPVVDVAVIQLHPRRADERDAFGSAFGIAASVGPDAIAVSAHDPEQLAAALARARRAAGLGRTDLRAILRRGPGVLSPRGVAGPLLDDAAHALQLVEWGDLSGAPRDDRARALRGISLGMLAVCGLAALPVAWRLAGPPDAGSAPEIAIEQTVDGVVATFDVPDDAWVSAFTVQDGHVRVLREASSPADKATWATGDGRYELVSEGGLLLAVHRGPLEGLDAALAAADRSDTPLPTLAERLDRQATVRWSALDVR